MINNICKQKLIFVNIKLLTATTRAKHSVAKLTAHTSQKAKGDCTQLKQKPLDSPRETKQLRDVRVSHFEYKTTPMS